MSNKQLTSNNDGNENQPTEIFSEDSGTADYLKSRFQITESIAVFASLEEHKDVTPFFLL